MTDNALLSTLRKLQPAKLKAYTSDDDVRDVAIPGGRKKWSQVIAALSARSWAYVVLLDKSGAELGTVTNTDPATEVEDLAPGGRATKELQHAERIVELVLKSNREVLSWRDSETKALLAAQGAVVGEMTKGMKALSEVWADQAEVAADVASNAAEAAAGGGQLQQLIEAAPVILQLLPTLKAMLAGPAEASPPNGHSKRKE